MPLPSKRKGQDHDSFIKSCMSSDVMKKEFSNIKQRYAVCESQFRRSKKKKQSKGSEENPTWQEIEKEPFIIDIPNN